MAGGGDFQGTNKRKREAAGKPSAGKAGGEGTKRNKPYDAPAPRGGGAKEKPQPVTAKDKRVAAKEMSESRKMKRKPNYNLEKKQRIQLSTSCSSSSPSQLRMNNMISGSNGAYFRAVDAVSPDSLEGGGSLDALAEVGSMEEHQEQQQEYFVGNDKRRHKWTPEEQQYLFTHYFSTSKKIEGCQKNVTEYCRNIANEMNEVFEDHPGYVPLYTEKVRCKVLKASSRLQPLVLSNKASVANYIAGMRVALCHGASSSQSESVQPPCSQSGMSTVPHTAFTVTDALSYMTDNMALSNDDCIKYSRALNEEPKVYLPVFNSHRSLNAKKEFLDHISAKK